MNEILKEDAGWEARNRIRNRVNRIKELGGDFRNRLSAQLGQMEDTPEGNKVWSKPGEAPWRAKIHDKSQLTMPGFNEKALMHFKECFDFFDVQQTGKVDIKD